ncbi:hypothetical protein ACM64Y_05010 [Novispirillum sp. DQ9]|uniref:glycoside hydrolase family 17 protein n=1 Tax=Novispirillum sp. DQ9 TaxID=3398612 RepID=UPI003C7993CE
MGRGPVIVVLALCAVAALGAWVWQGRAVHLEGPPVERLPCASYAPFRGAETPFDETFMVSEARIEEDLRALSALTTCVRTYATTNGLDAVPRVAERLGMQVLQGAWIGREAEANRVELDRALALAAAHPGAVRALVVGNEVLLRREQPVEGMVALLTEAKARSPVPITYADVWEFWVRAPEMAPLVDFVTVHILPYWEDDPVGVETAVAHVEEIRAEVAEVFAGKPLLVGETGWPTAGRQREGAEPSRLNQAKYMRALVTLAHEEGWDINFIEAFDQPWKRALEGTVGGAWGLIEDDRTVKPVLADTVVEIPAWRSWYAGSVALGLVPLLVAAGTRRRLDGAGWAVVLAGGLAAGGALAFFGHHAVEASRGLGEAAVNAVAFVLSGAAALGVVLALAARDPQPGTVLGWTRRLVLAMAAVAVLGMVFDARYRDFPASLFLAPAVGFALLALRQGLRDRLPRLPEDRWLAVVVAAGAVVAAAREGMLNGDAWAWAGVLVLLSLPLLVLPGRGAGGPGR